ncbi:kinase-like protein [Tothia fuscella]|uniref:Kinase-like protein n=1 Tax=Tothia fuscella TaxID=1048955 RepID=A0A9P4NX15_9PEZI|nr:kinase-like protein [Tothia fuscella]
MVSNVVGKSGRIYVQDKVLQRQREEKFSVLKAESQNEFFVRKPVRKPFYELSRTLAGEFAGSRRLRIHIDCNETEDILVYPFFRDTLLGIIQNDPDFPATERKKILRRVGEAIQELHSKDWIHMDVKPDNILVNWASDKDGKKTVSDVALGDFDIASKSEGGKARETPYAVGNAMWRSPEGQTGRGVTKASDIFSFGLVCIYTLGGGEFLLLNDYKELAERVPEGLYKHVNDKDWCEAMKASAEIADLAIEAQPELRFTSWSQELGSAAQDMMSGMTNLDPACSTTIDQVLTHRWWQELE